MSLFVDTSVWSHALRRDAPSSAPQVGALMKALGSGETIVITGIVLQELLQGFSGPKDRERIIDRFSALPLLVPDRQDHVDAAELRNACRRAGVQLATIDALIAQLCIRHSMQLLTLDGDFENAAKHSRLKLWPASPR
ncbi:MAG: PIN domain-containing protein [Gammaproteobacteria bacterium]|nr:PIN domain-containing protein [Gammaproteobacteria bacterium]